MDHGKIINAKIVFYVDEELSIWLSDGTKKLGNQLGKKNQNLKNYFKSFDFFLHSLLNGWSSFIMIYIVFHLDWWLK